ncbi:MAG TPA: hypothetical protein VHG32_13415 [Thermoanaerobaculia bacterium]|jgi:hypothetical protein|nr:hypothetical protein [Thermoanaerobaculia bacterium]
MIVEGPERKPIREAGAPMKSREEYLCSFQDKLLATLGETYKSLQQSFLLAYGLSMLLLLFAWGSVADLSFLGAKLNVERPVVVSLLPLFLAAVYILIDLQLFRVAGIYSAIYVEAGEIVKLNSEARPIYLTDLQHFESGIAGVILALSRWQANKLLTRSPFRSWAAGNQGFLAQMVWAASQSISIFNWAYTLVIRTCLALMLFLLPLVAAFYGIYEWVLVPQTARRALLFMSLVVLGISAIVTVGFVVFLFFATFVDLLKAFNGDLVRTAGNLREAAKELLESRLIKRLLRVGGVPPFTSD